MKSNIVGQDLMDKYSEHNFSLSLLSAVLVGLVNFPYPRQVKQLEWRNTCYKDGLLWL